MVRKGFVERQIETMAVALAQLLGMRQKGDLNAALLSIRAANKRLTGFDLDTLAGLPQKSLLGFFLMSDGNSVRDAGGGTTSGAKFDSGNAVVAGAMLDEAAQIYVLQENVAASQAMGTRALNLLLEADVHEPLVREDADTQRRIADLLLRLGPVAHTPFLLWQRFRRHEARGEFADAKNVLDALRQIHSTQGDKLMRDFYARLLTLDDGTLEAGGVSRPEVEEANDALPAL